MNTYKINYNGKDHIYKSKVDNCLDALCIYAKTPVFGRVPRIFDYCIKQYDAETTGEKWAFCFSKGYDVNFAIKVEKMK